MNKLLGKCFGHSDFDVFTLDYRWIHFNPRNPFQKAPKIVNYDARSEEDWLDSCVGEQIASQDEEESEEESDDDLVLDEDDSDAEFDLDLVREGFIVEEDHISDTSLSDLEEETE